MESQPNGEDTPKVRPRYSVGLPRTHKLQVYFNDDEYEVIKEKAKSLPLSTYCRQASLEFPDITLEPFHKKR